jgi:vesicular inhibitory amino acid transporter
MFGDGVMTEITANLLQTPGYPPSLSILASIFIAIIPLTKVPLAARPIVSTIEILWALDPSSRAHAAFRIAIRVAVLALVVVVAIAFPAFDRIMAFMGSALCFTICVILPLLFHLRLFGGRISRAERWLNYALVAVSSVLAIVGTVWAVLPPSWVGAG